MASKLLVIRQTRPSLDVPFFVLTEEKKANAQAELIPMVIGERIIANGLRKVRTIFFTSAQAYSDWQTSAVIQENSAEQREFNIANGIISDQHLVEMPDYNPFK